MVCNGLSIPHFVDWLIWMQVFVLPHTYTNSLTKAKQVVFVTSSGNQRGAPDVPQPLADDLVFMERWPALWSSEDLPLIVVGASDIPTGENMAFTQFEVPPGFELSGLDVWAPGSDIRVWASSDGVPQQKTVHGTSCCK